MNRFSQPKIMDIQCVLELGLVHVSGDVLLVSEDEEGDLFQCGLGHQLHEFLLGGINVRAVGGVNNEDDGVHPTAVALPHATETRLATNVPEFYGNVSCNKYKL